MPLAVVSRKVTEPEQQPKSRLLERTTRSISLTDTGRDCFQSCRRLLGDMAEAQRDASGEYRAPNGSFAASAPACPVGTRLSCAYRPRFPQAYPEIDLGLRLGAGGDNLIKQQLDVAVRVGPIRHFVCASPDYLKRRGMPQRPSELTDHDCVTLAPNETATEWVFMWSKSAEKYPVGAHLTVTTVETAVDAAVAGVGNAQLFCYQVSNPIVDGKLELLIRDFAAAAVPGPYGPCQRTANAAEAARVHRYRDTATEVVAGV